MKLFTKKLTRTDIGRRMSIPTRKLNLLPPFQSGHHAVELQIEDRGGRMWKMCCTVRKQKHKKPVMASGWKQFVRSNNLGIGDKVTFYRVKDEVTAEMKYKVEVKKALKIFGAIIGYKSL